MTTAAVEIPSSCSRCGTSLAPTSLGCPSCGQLVHSAELKKLAEQASAASDPLESVQLWRSAIALLPSNSRQHAVIRERIDSLSRQIDQSPEHSLPGRGQSVVGAPPAEVAGPTKQGKPIGKGIGGALLAIGLLLMKFKTVLLLLLTKGKLLLLGLTKMSTLLTMFATFGAYWALWGWKFAAGIVLSIYVHEMGHVAALRRFGIRASAPMFIPGLGALVRLKEPLHSALEDARVGLAGPIWGCAAALLVWGASWAAGSQMLAVIASVGAWINLFNLIPVWQLDGSRAFRVLSQGQRWLAVAAIGLAYALTREGLLVLVLCVAGYRAFGKDADPRGDNRTLADFALLVLILSWLGCQLPDIAVPASGQ